MLLSPAEPTASALSADDCLELGRVHALSDWQPGHVQQVRRIAAWLFVALREHHGLDTGDQRLLEAGALLHDVGYPTDPPRHHKVSARIIRANLGGPFDDAAIQTIALLARYHRKGGPKSRHRRFAALDARGRAALCWLAGVLRVADGLDRQHITAAQGITTALVDGRLEVRVHGDGHPLDEDIAGGMRKRDVLERAAGMPVLVRPA